METAVWALLVGVVLAIFGYRYATRNDVRSVPPPSATVTKALEERNEIIKEEIKKGEGEYDERKKSFFDRYSKYLRK